MDMVETDITKRKMIKMDMIEMDMAKMVISIIRKTNDAFDAEGLTILLMIVILRRKDVTRVVKKDMQPKAVNILRKQITWKHHRSCHGTMHY